MGGAGEGQEVGLTLVFLKREKQPTQRSLCAASVDYKPGRALRPPLKQLQMRVDEVTRC